MLNNIFLESFAKLNISLQILNKRPDGYHNIYTIFQEIDLSDKIIIEKKSSGCDFSTNVDWLKNDSFNLCVKAWEKMVEEFGIGGVSIHLDKQIPAGSGLGGGSSNAATILKGLRQLYGINVLDNHLEKIAAQIGADVPFFIKGGLQIGEGVGDQLNKLNKLIKGFYLLVIPEIHIDTTWAYNKWKNFLQSSKEKVNFARLIERDKIPFKLFENDFETIVVPAYPEIGKIKEIMQGKKALYTSLSGSGSTVYGVFDNEADAKFAESSFPAPYKTFIAQPL